ncbi:hypothetical protein LOCC1_G005271 [Lachnellula occidentalis]|uniref:Regulator of chromosome condensation-like protein n=1 Tax=Lachnellula occidentalis TaxID=215460 RepID=A0A8H8RRB6_9HELO|nr:hypothetical protein LOCC1_G005271 [Lachnellula occidentalis]
MPRPLLFMSGDFDDPRASDSHEHADRIIQDILDNTRSTDEISPSGQLVNFIERYHRRRRLENPATQELPDMTSESDPEGQQGNRGAHSRSPLFVLPPQPTQPAVPLPLPRERSSRIAGMNARRARPRLPPSDRYLERQRERQTEPSGENNVAASRGPMRGLDELRAATRELNEASSNLLQDAGRQLELASSTLRGFLHEPGDRDSSLRNSEYPGEGNRRVKRRKLDTDKLGDGFTGFKYGRYGQVEPGKLKMEIVSCDGGIFDEPSIRGDFAAENVLRNDATVYCTKSNRCNLVLRHQGSTVFSLKELIIKAPHTGYTAPVQEGMVFISMTSDDLLARTAQYQIQYSPPRDRRSASERSNELPPIRSIRHLDDSQMTPAQAAEARSRIHDDGSMTVAQARARRLYDIGLRDDDCDYRTAQIPSDFTTNAPPFQVTTECSDSEDDDATARQRHRSLHRLMGASLRFEDSDSDNSGQLLLPEDIDYSSPLSPGITRRETASNITLSEAAEASQIATQEAVRAVGGELMAPHARFFIERDKSKCTVRFDPPVSGRFILLKMWSPHHSPSGNIDIQSVVAKGFAGPRFFPAVTMR